MAGIVKLDQTPLASMDNPITSDEIKHVVLEELCLVLRSSTDAVSYEASFAQLGSHSLAAVALSSACKRRGISLGVEATLLSRTILELMDHATKDTSSWAFEQPLGQNKSPKPGSTCVLDCKPKSGSTSQISKLFYSTPRFISSTFSVDGLSSRASVGSCMMTEMQLSLVHGSLVFPSSNVVRYFIPVLTRDLPIMERAWRTVINMEPIFRARFDFSESRGILVSLAVAPFRWAEVTKHTLETYEEELNKEELQPEFGTSFKVVNLNAGAPCETTTTLVWTTHHALIDGYSASIVISKVQQVALRRPVCPGHSFFEMATQVQSLQQKASKSSKLFWDKQKLLSSSATSKILLPRPSSQTASKGRLVQDVYQQIPISDVTSFAQRLGISSASVFYGAWAVLLSKYMDSDTVVFGTVLSGRNLPLEGVESTIGPLINTLPFFIFLQRATTTTEYLRHIFSHMVELGSFSFSIPGDGYRREFSSALAVEVDMPSLNLNDVQSDIKSYYKISPTIPLSVIISSCGWVRLIYHTDKYSKKDIKLLAVNYRNAILAIMRPEYTVGDCMGKILSAECREKLFRLGNCYSDTTSQSSVHDDLVTLFEQVVAAHPDAIAVEKGGYQATYEDIDTMSCQVSWHLSDLMKPGDFVGVHADRTVNWIVAIYGILKAGGVYCPIDPALPPSLRDANYQAAGCKLFLTSRMSEKCFQPSSCTLCLSVEEILTSNSTTSQVEFAFRPQLASKPSAVAYVCFTSGSQGKPKGVICSHEGLVAFQKDQEVRLFAEPGCKISQIMSPAFDGSIHEIFSALSYGATLVLPCSADPFAHLSKVKSAILTPSIAQLLKPEDYPGLLNLYLVGEAVPQNVNDLWAKTKRLYNMYGPTEGTCGATIKRLYPRLPVDIGRPNPSSRLYILDRHQCLVPSSVIGEIYIAGVQVARGYINRPDETEVRFFADHILGRGQMYRTGDRGYWNSSGCISYVGRIDRQIKLRGNRLDLEELEYCISQAIPEVTSVVVFIENDYLALAVRPGWLDPKVLRAKIAQKLPSYAVPKYSVALDAFPLTPAGKLNQKAIISAYKSNLELTDISPMTPSERLVTSVWHECMQLGSGVKINRDSNFVDMGGHSITQLLLTSRLTTLLQRQIPIQLIYQFPTLRKLAAAIDDIYLHEATLEALPGLPLGDHCLSPIEQDWWYKYKLEKGTSTFTVSYVCALAPEVVNRTRLVEAWNTVLARHRILRSRYVELAQDCGLTRSYSEDPPRAYIVSDVNIREEINRSFQLDKDDLIRVIVSENCMLVCVSHILCDLTTLKTLLREMTMTYTGVRLPPVSQAYMETKSWNNVVSQSKLSFWTKSLSATSNQPFASKRLHGRRSFEGKSHIYKLPGLFARLRSFTNDSGFTFHQVVLSAVALALETDPEEVINIVLGSPYLNRQSSEMDVVGLFLEPLPVHLQYMPSTSSNSTAASSSSRDFIHSVQNSLQATISHAVPWTQLLQHLGVKPEDHLPNHPLFDIMVTFHDDRSSSSSPSLMAPLPGLEPLVTWTEGAKFALMCEFCALSDETLLLRLEFDTDLSSDVEIRRLTDRIIEAVECLTADMSFADICTRLRRMTGEARPLLNDLDSYDSLFGANVGIL